MLLSYLATEIVIPVCAVVGILFSLLQWYLVSRVRVTPDRNAPAPGTNAKKNGFNDHLIEEEEGVTDQNVVAKCAEIQNAISEGTVPFLCVSLRSCSHFLRSGVCFGFVIISFKVKSV